MKGDSVLAVWEDLPNPSLVAPDSGLTSILVVERYWRKIVAKHLCNGRQPWADIFGRTTVDQLVAAPHGPFNQGNAAEASKTALAILEDEVRACLNLPIALIYTSLGARGIDGQRWLLPLPSGAIAVIYIGPAEKILRTCYFTGAASVDLGGRKTKELKSRRWQIALRALVQEYSARDDAGQRYMLPGRQHRREKNIVGQQPEMCIDVRFVSPRIWGFAGDQPGSEWTAPVWSWPAAGGGQTARS